METLPSGQVGYALIEIAHTEHFCWMTSGIMDKRLNPDSISGNGRRLNVRIGFGRKEQNYAD